MARSKPRQPKDPNRFDEDGLTTAERRCIDLVISHGNKLRAVRQVYGERKVSPGAVFSRPQVAMVLERELREYRRRYTLQKEWVLQQLAYLARFDPRKLFNEDGSPRPIQDLDEATAACIVGVDVEDMYEGRGEDRMFIGNVRKYKLSSKTEAIALAMKYLQLLEGEGNSAGDRLNEVIAAFKAGPATAPKQIEGEGRIE